MLRGQKVEAVEGNKCCDESFLKKLQKLNVASKHFGNCCGN